MADDTTTSSHASSYDGQGQGGRGAGGRGQGQREPGGFRIRLSDNEMRAARAVQEAFQLRSTVAALGFSIRTVAQLLEDGQLDELVAQQRSQAGHRSDGPRAGGRRQDGRGEGRAEGRGDGRGERRAERAPRIDPFARPARPAAVAAEAEPVEAAEPLGAEPAAAEESHLPDDETPVSGDAPEA